MPSPAAGGARSLATTEVIPFGLPDPDPEPPDPPDVDPDREPVVPPAPEVDPPELAPDVAAPDDVPEPLDAALPEPPPADVSPLPLPLSPLDPNEDTSPPDEPPASLHPPSPAASAAANARIPAPHLIVRIMASPPMLAVTGREAEHVSLPRCAKWSCLLGWLSLQRNVQRPAIEPNSVRLTIRDRQ